MIQQRNVERLSQSNIAWVNLLRTNLLTMIERPGVARAVSISRGFPHGTEAERETVIVLAQRMAEEYGLLAEMDIRGSFVTIRFTRPAVKQCTETPKGQSLFSKALGFLSSRRRSDRQERTEESQAQEVRR